MDANIYKTNVHGLHDTQIEHAFLSIGQTIYNYILELPDHQLEWTFKSPWSKAPSKTVLQKRLTAYQEQIGTVQILQLLNTKPART